MRKNNALILERKIYHYVDDSSRSGLDMTDVTNRLWMDYFIDSAVEINRMYPQNLTLTLKNFNYAMPRR